MKALKQKLEQKIYSLESTLLGLRNTNTELESIIKMRKLSNGQSNLQTEALFESMSALLDWHSRETASANSSRDMLLTSCLKLLEIADKQAKIIESVPTLCQRLISCIKTNVPPIDEIVNDFGRNGLNIGSCLTNLEFNLSEQSQSFNKVLDVVAQFQNSEIDPSICSQLVEFLKNQVQIERQLIFALEKEKKNSKQMRDLILEIETLLECDRPLTRQSISQIASTRINRLKQRASNDRSAFQRLNELGGLIGQCEFARFGEFIEESDPNEMIELRSKINQMDLEHEVILQISQQLAIDGNVGMRMIDRLETIRRKLEESQTANSQKNSEVIPRLMKKLERMSNDITEKDDYIGQLESQLHETKCHLQTDVSVLQAKMSEQEGFLDKIRSELKLDNGEYGNIVCELVKVEKARKVGSIAHGRLKQIILTIATWIEEFENATLDELSRKLIEWYHISDPFIDVHEIVCQVIDIIRNLKALKHQRSDSSIVSIVSDESAKRFAEHHSPLISAGVKSWEDYCQTLLYNVNLHYKIGIPRELSSYFVQQLRVQKRILLSSRDNSTINRLLSMRILLPLISAKPLIFVLIFLRMKQKSKFPNASAAIRRLYMET
jgi:hypothetical protein